MNDSFEPEITVLYCGRALAKGSHLPEGTMKGKGFKVRFAMIPCSSKVEVGYLIKLIEEGADGVVLAVCPEDHCQFMLGSVRAENRVKYARHLLEEVGIEGNRLSAVQAHDFTAAKFTSIAEEHAGLIRTLGQNPVKSIR
ncbi:MAG: hydrogenase iron-sulfur subunit [Dehalococcoidia bacterium]